VRETIWRERCGVRFAGLSVRQAARDPSRPWLGDAGKTLQNCWEYVSIESSSCRGRTYAPQVQGAARVVLRPKRSHVLALRTRWLVVSAPDDAVVCVY